MKNYELGFYRMGHGTTVCNKLEEENGDYKRLGNISPLGQLKLRVADLPKEVLKQINAMIQADEFEYEGVTVRKNARTVTQGEFYILNKDTRAVLAEYPLEIQSWKRDVPTDYLMNDDQIKKVVEKHLKNNINA